MTQVQQERHAALSYGVIVFFSCHFLPLLAYMAAHSNTLPSIQDNERNIKTKANQQNTKINKQP